MTATASRREPSSEVSPGVLGALGALLHPTFVMLEEVYMASEFVVRETRDGGSTRFVRQDPLVVTDGLLQSPFVVAGRDLWQLNAHQARREVSKRVVAIRHRRGPYPRFLFLGAPP